MSAMLDSLLSAATLADCLANDAMTEADLIAIDLSYAKGGDMREARASCNALARQIARPSELERAMQGGQS